MTPHELYIELQIRGYFNPLVRSGLHHRQIREKLEADRDNVFKYWFKEHWREEFLKASNLVLEDKLELTIDYLINIV